MLELWQEKYIKNNLTKDKNCNNCKHIEGCTLELLKENKHPDKYVCSNFERQGDKKWIKN